MALPFSNTKKKGRGKYEIHTYICHREASGFLTLPPHKEYS